MMGICVTKLTGLADSWNTNKWKFMCHCTVFASFYIFVLILRAISNNKPPEGLLCNEFGGLNRGVFMQ